MRGTFLVAILLTLLCSGSGACVTGRVRGVGKPVAVGVVVQDAAGLRLRTAGVVLRISGPDSELVQLRRIPGAIIEVRGTLGAERIRLRSFSIQDAGDGMKPVVGRLIVDQGGVRVADEVSGGHITLRGPQLREIKQQHGSRIWVTGSIVGPQALLIAHWGLLAPAVD